MSERVAHDEPEVERPTLSGEILEEAVRLVSHPHDEIGRLQEVARRGESAATPLIALTEVALLIGAIFAVVVAIAFLAYALG